MDRSTSRRTNSTSSSPPTTTRYHGARYRSPTTPIILPTSPPSALLTPGRLPDVSPPVTRVPVIPDSDHTSSSPSISSNDSYQTNTTSYPTMVPIEPVNHIYVTQPTWVPLPTAPVIPEEVPRQTNTALPQTYGRLVPSGYDPIPLPSEKRLEEISKGPYHLRSRLLTDPTPGAVEHFADGVARFMLRLLFLDIPHVYFKRVFKLAATPQGQSGGRGVVTRTNPVTSPVAPSKDEWTTLVESTIKEWETLNILSGLTFSAVLTMLQFDNVRKGANSYVAAVIALTFAFWACILGCVYIVRFVSMKTPDMEYFWMKEAQEWNVNKYFNMWLLLAMPAVMAAWAVIALWFAILAMTFPGNNLDSTPVLSERAQVASFVSIVVILVIGSICCARALLMFQSWEGQKPRERYFWAPYTTTSQGFPVAEKHEGYNGSQHYTTTLH